MHVWSAKWIVVKTVTLTEERMIIAGFFLEVVYFRRNIQEKYLYLKVRYDSTWVNFHYNSHFEYLHRQHHYCNVCKYIVHMNPSNTIDKNQFCFCSKCLWSTFLNISTTWFILWISRTYMKLSVVSLVANLSFNKMWFIQIGYIMPFA